VKTRACGSPLLCSLAAAILATGCTGQLPGSFRYQQKVEVFSTSQQVNTAIDLL